MLSRMIRVVGLVLVVSAAVSGCAGVSGRGANAPIAHVVLVGFKEGTSSAVVAQIVEEAHKLPKKIPGFLDFHGGANNSPEGLDQGHSHGFVMTFESAEALQHYRSHPAHETFAAFAKSKRENSFVFDLAVEAPPPADPGNVQHLVFFKYNDDATEEKLAEVHRRFAALKGKIPGLIGYAASENVNPGRAQGFTHGYLITFTDAAARDAYLPHPAHTAFVDIVKPLLAGVLVVDYANGD